MSDDLKPEVETMAREIIELKGKIDSKLNTSDYFKWLAIPAAAMAFGGGFFFKESLSVEKTAKTAAEAFLNEPLSAEIKKKIVDSIVSDAKKEVVSAIPEYLKNGKYNPLKWEDTFKGLDQLNGIYSSLPYKTNEGEKTFNIQTSIVPTDAVSVLVLIEATFQGNWLKHIRRYHIWTRDESNNDYIITFSANAPQIDNLYNTSTGMYWLPVTKNRQIRAKVISMIPEVDLPLVFDSSKIDIYGGVTIRIVGWR